MNIGSTIFERGVVTAACAALFFSGCGGGSGDGDPDGGEGVGPDAAESGDPDGGGTGGDPDADVPSFTLTQVVPEAASRQVDTDVTVHGADIEQGAELHLHHCDADTVYDLTESVEVAGDGTSLAAHLPADADREQGLYSVVVTNPGGATAELECAFTVHAGAPPTVTDVVASTAWRGISGDGILSDETVTIRGTDFSPTPAVRWVKADGSVSYDAILVGFTSDTEITAVVPSETFSMEVGEYHVFVTNPNLLEGQWLVPGDGEDGKSPGIFTITDVPPPSISDVTPNKIPRGECEQTLSLSGRDFHEDAQPYYMVPEGTACEGAIRDPNDAILCPLEKVDQINSSQMSARFGECPENGTYPAVVQNPDGQLGHFFSIQVRNSSDGHLDTEFDAVPETLQTARWKHALTFGFDAFANGYLYVVGGQDIDREVLGSVEISQVNVFGTVGPLRRALQFGDADAPRVANDLNVPRQGSTIVRVGRDLFSIGGAAETTDQSPASDEEIVVASDVVERARILSYDEMPGVRLPEERVGGSLPEGSWYYRVSAVGPWGESLATREVTVFRAGDSIEVCWVDPVRSGATGFNIYRSLASDGRANSTALIAADVQGECFIDDGEAEQAPAPGRVRGSVVEETGLEAGDHVYRVSSLVDVGGDTFETYAGYPAEVELTADDVNAGNAAVRVAWDEVDGASYRLYKFDSEAGEFRELDTGGPLAETSFVDDGAPFVADGATPREEIEPLAPGSLSRWQVVDPSMNSPREGLDGVVVGLDPETSDGVVARILVAGGRTDNSGDENTYLHTAESLAIFEDGTLAESWHDESPEFTHARVYYPLMTTQTRRDTNFPPPPEEPPIRDDDDDDDDEPGDPDGGIIVQSQTSSAEPPFYIQDLDADEPVYVIALGGDSERTEPTNTGRSDFEACLVGDDGHLACGELWEVQDNSLPAGQGTFGHDALLYSDFIYPFLGVASEDLNETPHTRNLRESAAARFTLADLEDVTENQVIERFESSNASPSIPRGYYKMTRMMGYLYTVGGYTDTGPTDTLERIQE